MSAQLGFVFTFEDGKAREAREGESTPRIPSPGASGKRYNLSKEGNTNE
jgi:hypothetical protein